MHIIDQELTVSIISLITNLIIILYDGVHCIESSRRGLKADQLGTATPAEEEMQDKGYWITTLPTGERIANRLNGASVEVQNAVLCVASDPQTLQVFSFFYSKMILF